MATFNSCVSHYQRVHDGVLTIQCVFLDFATIHTGILDEFIMDLHMAIYGNILWQVGTQDELRDYVEVGLQSHRSTCI